MTPFKLPFDIKEPISCLSQGKPWSRSKPLPTTSAICSCIALIHYINVANCVSRCVRRAFLCGEVPFSGESYEHRREWIQDRLFELAKVFAIDIAAYAIMSNHYHLVLHIDKETASAWTTLDVIEQWHLLFTGTRLTHRYLKGETMSQAEQKAVLKITEEWRSRLMDISWFMRCLNEPIARQANREDGCSGRFWEGRFKSQALLDEKALVACLAYVDLNPIRADTAETPEASDFTSLQNRAHAAQHVKAPNQPEQQPMQLLPFAGNPRQEMPKGIQLQLTDYLEQVDGQDVSCEKRNGVPFPTTFHLS